MIDRRAAQREVRRRFLAPGNPYGCAESLLAVLERRFELPGADDGRAAMALNGGVAWSGGTCGALTGGAVAVGALAGSRIRDRARAKRVARAITAGLVDDFAATFGATDCRTLTGVDLRAPGGHEAFLADGRWRTDCVRRLELAVDRLAPLAEPAAWQAACRLADGEPLVGADGEPPSGSGDAAEGGGAAAATARR